MPAGRPLKFKSPEDLQGAIDKYFAECKKGQEPLTITGLALALEIDRRTLTNYSHKDEFFPTIKKARMLVEQQVEKSLISGSAVAGSIFWLKNNAEWVDKTEQDVKTHHTVTLLASDEEL